MNFLTDESEGEDHFIGLHVCQIFDSIRFLEKAWRTFRARRHFVVKPKKLTLSPNPNLNPNPSPNP